MWAVLHFCMLGMRNKSRFSPNVAHLYLHQIIEHDLEGCLTLNLPFLHKYEGPSIKKNKAHLIEKLYGTSVLV